MKKNTLLIVAIAVFLILVVAIIVILKKVTFKTSTVPDDLLDESKLTDAEQKKIKEITELVKEWLDAYFIFRGSEVPIKLINLSDTYFVSVFNEFAVYEKKTLKQWFDYITWHGKNENAVKAVQQRFKDLEDKGIRFDETGKIIKVSIF